MPPPAGSTIELCSPTMEHTISYGSTTKKRRVGRIIGVAIVVVVLIGAAFLIGYFVKAKCEKSNGSPDNSSHRSAVVAKYHKQLQDLISAEELEQNLRYFSGKPHMAGSARQLELAEYLAKKWREYEFDEVEMPEYNVLLSVPQEDKPNRVTVVNNGSIVQTIPCQIEVAPEPNAKMKFNYTTYYAYSPNGTAEGKLVYVNQGRTKDLMELEKRNISVNGTIVLVKGMGGVAGPSLLRGAIGALIFLDPKTNSKEGSLANETYPNTEWMSEDAVFEKPLNLVLGDPLTPGIPAIDGMFRKSRNETTSSMPSIPIQPISYEDARTLLSRLGGEEVPKEWQGDLDVTYRFGPGFNNSNATVRMEVHNQFVMKKIYNVVGTIRGSEEPDRYVLIGNHRDAWLFGAVDPSSGTACLAEISRVVGKLLSSGWRPRRTLKFCSWGAEEFGLIGSVEWVEQYVKILMDRAVAYLNTDVAVGGNQVMVAQTCPSLTGAIFDWAKKVKDPNAHDEKQSIYDIMLERTPSKITPNEPMTIPYWYFSDYMPFYMYAGVPSADFSYFFGYKGNWSLYPVYHTQEDTFYWMKTFVDPQFLFHKAVAKFEAGLLLELADTPILPFDISRLRKALNQTCKMLSRQMKTIKIDISHVNRALDRFVNASEAFECALSKLTENDSPMTLRMFNDQMMQVEKAFISSAMMTRDTTNRHVVARGKTPGVRMAKASGNLEEVKRQVSIVAQAINAAADILQPIQSPCPKNIKN